MNPLKHTFVLILLLLAGLQVEAAHGEGSKTAGDFKYCLLNDSFSQPAWELDLFAYFIPNQEQQKYRDTTSQYISPCAQILEEEVFASPPGSLAPKVLCMLAEDLAKFPELRRLFDSAENVGWRFVKAWEGLINIPSLRRNIGWLTRSSKWLDEGAELVTTNGVTKLKKGGQDILEIKNEKILPIKKESYHNGSGGSPIGEPANGYQVVKVGSDLKVKRVPDESLYVNEGYLNKLKEHPNAHTLERHGHDVTDDALIKRATEGIAPDGSTIGSNPPYTLPPYSSKFDSTDALKNAYDNTKPGSSAFLNTVESPPGTKTVLHTLPNGQKYGKGVAAGQTNFQNTSMVRATYVNDGNGNWQLVTMFPDF